MYSAREFIGRLGHQLSLLCVPEGFEPSSPDSVTRIEHAENTGYLGGMILHTADGSWYELALIACGRVSHAYPRPEERAQSRPEAPRDGGRIHE